MQPINYLQEYNCRIGIFVVCKWRGWPHRAHPYDILSRKL